MPRLIHFEIDEEALIDEAYAFVTDPRPTRTERPIYRELSEFSTEMVDVLESMVIDGTEERQDVADYIHAVFPPSGR